MPTRWIAGLSLLVAVITAVVNAQEKEPLIGTWRLNVAKSTFPGPPPQSGTRTFEDAGGGFIYVRTDLADASGNKGTERMLVRRDGKDYAIASPAGPATIALTVKSETPFTGEGIIKLEGKGIMMLSETLSSDGKTHTITSKAEIGPPGSAIRATIVQVWEKQ
jgi:hypothetical protein